MGGPWGNASGPGPGCPYMEAGVVGPDGPAEPESVIWPMAPRSTSSGPPLPAAFSAFLIASVVRRFSTAPCISPEAHRPVLC